MIAKTDLMTASEMRDLLNVTDRTLTRYRLKHWVEGVHFVAPVQRVMYVRPMIMDWILNRKTNPIAHQDAMEAWVRTHQHSQARSRRKAG
jgi:hypothetical protein